MIKVLEQPVEGRRARKMREMRESIAGAAVGLFLDQGYHETTVDAIAQAAGISRRTFFYYFESKLAVLQTLEDAMAAEFSVEFRKLPCGLIPLEAAQQVLAVIIERYYVSQYAVALDQLMRSTESLRAQRQANYESRERALVKALQEYCGEAEATLGLLMTAVATVGALRVAVDRWNLSMGEAPVQNHFHNAMRSLRAEMSGCPTHSVGTACE